MIKRRTFLQAAGAVGSAGVAPWALAKETRGMPPAEFADHDLSEFVG